MFDSTLKESEESSIAIGEACEVKLRSRPSDSEVEATSGLGSPLPSLDRCDPPAKVSVTAAFTALQEDVVKLEKSIVQLTQHKQEDRKQQKERKMQRLEEQADRINVLAEQLAAEMSNFQEMAQHVNSNCSNLNPVDLAENSGSATQDASTEPVSGWEIQEISVPTIVKRDSQFVLMAIAVEKPKTEEEDAARRTAKAQQRREALESWLEAQRKRMIDKFSGL